MSETELAKMEAAEKGDLASPPSAVPVTAEAVPYQDSGSNGEQVPLAHSAAAAPGEDVVEVIYVAEIELPQRMAFLRRVFGILSVMLIVSFAITLAFFIPGCSSPTADTPESNVTCVDTSPRSVIRSSSWIFWVVLIGWIILFVSLSLAQKLIQAQSKAVHYTILSVFTLATGCFLGVVSCYSSISEVAIAIALCVLISVSIIALTCCSFTNGFVGPAPYIAVACISVFWTCWLFVFPATGYFWFTYWSILWSGLGVLLFSMFIVYDTTQILGGSHRKVRFTAQDECLAAQSLFMDIVGLFLCLLSGGRY